MDANLNNPAAALIAASQPAAGSQPGGPGAKAEPVIGSPGAPAGESEFSSKIRSLQSDSAKETRASESAGSSTDTPRNEPATPADTSAAKVEQSAAGTDDEQTRGAAGESPSPGPDGKPLPATGKDLPLTELMADAKGDAEPAQPEADPAEQANAGPAPQSAIPALDMAPSAPDSSDQLPVTNAAVDAETTGLQTAQASDTDGTQPVQARPDEARAISATTATPVSPTGPERSATPVAGTNLSPASTTGPAAVSSGTRNDNATMNFDGGAGAQAGQAANSESQAPPGGTQQRVAFSAELPTLTTPGSTAPASATTASATLAELDTLAGTRPLQAQAGQEQFARGLGERMLLMADGGLQSARIKLSPENLGPLDIRIQVQDDATQVWFNASQGQTREILEQAMPRLRELLAEQGMRLTDANVSGGDDGGSQEAGDEAQSPVRDWREPPPPTLEERLAGRSLNQLIEARRLLDVYA